MWYNIIFIYCIVLYYISYLVFFFFVGMISSKSRFRGYSCHIFTAYYYKGFVKSLYEITHQLLFILYCIITMTTEYNNNRSDEYCWREHVVRSIVLSRLVLHRRDRPIIIIIHNRTPQKHCITLIYTPVNQYSKSMTSADSEKHKKHRSLEVESKNFLRQK